MQTAYYPCFGRKAVGIAAWLIGSAVIATWLVFVPFLIGTSVASGMAGTAHSYTPAALGSVESNKTLKGDRLFSAHIKAGNRDAEPAKADATKSRRKIPVGCEAAFSKLVASANFTVRCVTSVDTLKSAV